MKTTYKLAAGAAALLSLSQPALAQGATCIQPADLADATTYAMPLFLEGLQTKCADTLPEQSFVRSESAALSQRFVALSDEAWPGARRVLVSFIERETGTDRADAQAAGSSSAGVIQLLMQMEGDDLRPFVDAMATQMIAEEIEPGTCGDIEAVLPLLAPLPPENYGALLSTIVGFVARDDETMKLCRADK